MEWEPNQRPCNDIIELHKQMKKKINNREFCEWWSLLQKTHHDILSELNVYPVYCKAIQKECPENVLQSCSPPCWYGRVHVGFMAMCQGALTDLLNSNLKNTCVTSVTTRTASMCQVILILARKKAYWHHLPVLSS